MSKSRSVLVPLAAKPCVWVQSYLSPWFLFHHVDTLKLRKMNGGYGTLENGSLDLDSSSSAP